MGTSQTVRIAPTFARTICFCLISLATTFVAITLADLVTGKSPSQLVLELSRGDDLFFALGILAAIVACGSLLIVGLGRFGAIYVSAHQITGRTEKLRRLTIPTDSVSEIVYRPNRYSSTLYINSTSTDHQIAMVTIGLNRNRIRDELTGLLGPLHPLTRWFHDHAA